MAILNMSTASSGVERIPPTADTVDLLVTIGKQKFEGAAGASLIDLSLEQSLGQPAFLKLRLAAWDSDTDALTWVDDPLFKPGTSIDVELGYVDLRKPMFWGEIVSLDLEASTTERAVLTVNAYDVLHRFGRGEQDRSFERSSYAAIARSLAKTVYKVAIDAPDDAAADPKNKVVYQRRSSDLKFLTDSAARIGYDFFADPAGKTLVFRKSHIGDPPSLTLDASRDLVQFSASLDAAGQLGGVKVTAFDSDTKKKIEVSVDNPHAQDDSYGSVPSRSLISDTVLTTQEQATAHAKAELLRIRSNYLTASGSCFGRTDLRPGAMISIAGLGTRFGGAYYVVSTTHTLSATGGYRTSFRLQGAPR